MVVFFERTADATASCGLLSITQAASRASGKPIASSTIATWAIHNGKVDLRQNFHELGQRPRRHDVSRTHPIDMATLQLGEENGHAPNPRERRRRYHCAHRARKALLAQLMTGTGQSLPSLPVTRNVRNAPRISHFNGLSAGYAVRV